ncbi:SDR family oxidoreductase [Cryptosporangium phraense]|uniref:SDR family oxidoreductase n=1 Tax=Cryptosporangium phraense TaxID=2593070 RepID=A0A545AYJ2_9ACTN|nr:SDR family oxidoreductase [Cryptosporangium phraense]TQS46393.1 SDR family oxidoreductase [Cryptosporangium phraense]
MAPLSGRVALVTGAGRRAGIGAAIARRLVADGATVLLHGSEPTDELRGLAMDLAVDGARVATARADFVDPAAPGALVQEALDQFGHLDILIANHARSVPWEPFAAVTAEEIDLSYAVNTRATLLLVREYAAAGPANGRVVLMTSGQQHGPMPLEIPYASSKAALAGITLSLAAALAPHATVNCVNPGPTDTGWTTETEGFGRPEDAARLIAWLVGPEAGWVTGQVISSDGGFSLTRP